MPFRQTGLLSSEDPLTTSAGAVRRRATAECPQHARAAAAPPAIRGRTATLALASSMVISFLAASAAPTPLYGRYEALWHATPLIGTLAFAVYALAVLAGLLWLAELPTLLGRRPMLLAAIGGQIVALGLFAIAGSFALILVGRVVQGIAAGAALGTLSAVMIEADPGRGTIASAASPPAGTGTGTLLSGLVVQFLPWPTHTVYLVLLGVLGLQALGVAAIVPAAPRRRPSLASLRPRVAIPAGARTAFAGAAPALVAVWALAGFYGALSPALYVALAHDPSVWRSALGMFLLACMASVATVVLRRRDGRVMTLIGTTTLLAGLALTVGAVLVGSAPLYLVASAVAGVGFGAGFQGPIRTLVPLARTEQRPALLSAVFVVSYVAMGVPAIAAGALVSGGVSLTAVAVGLSVIVAALTACALGATLRRA